MPKAKIMEEIGWIEKLKRFLFKSRTKLPSDPPKKLQSIERMTLYNPPKPRTQRTYENKENYLYVDN